MIPKPLNEIRWADIVALKESGREEDDMIEFKSSFSGGSDFIEFTESQRVKAVEGIAREAIAFLNGRGGDIVIGVREAANDHPKIEEITPVNNIDKTVDRLAQSLAAQIEPTQSILSIRAVRQNDGDTDGVIVVRCQSSLRAPHRFRPNNVCYIRRGRESVPMPMDEVQDVTLNRAMRRSEKLQMLDSLFQDLGSDKIARQQLPNRRFRIRVVFMPWINSESPIEKAAMEAFKAGDAPIFSGSRKLQGGDPFWEVGFRWRPVLRGFADDAVYLRGSLVDTDRFDCHRKQIYTNRLMVLDGAFYRTWSNAGGTSFIVNSDWVQNFLGHSLWSIRKALLLSQAHLSGTIRIGLHISEDMNLIFDGSVGTYLRRFDDGRHILPDFPVDGIESFNEIFVQAHIDVSALAQSEPHYPVSFVSTP